ncbi:MAG: VOC family protein [Hyphomicrobiaceae bacterium]
MPEAGRNHDGLVPELIVSDLGASLHFYCELLGFRIRHTHESERFACRLKNACMPARPTRSSSDNSLWQTRMEVPPGHSRTSARGQDARIKRDAAHLPTHTYFRN